jgi:Putative MetA-pathway of phenol degradation
VQADRVGADYSNMTSRRLSRLRPLFPPWGPSAAGLALMIACAARPANAQEVRDPRAAMPERPTVATHAYAVAPGIVELETGVQWQRPTPASGTLLGPVLFKIGLGDRVQLDVAPGWAWLGPDGRRQGGLADSAIGVKWQVAEGLPALANLALQATVKLPTGSVERGTGTGTTDLNVLLISSRAVGPVSLDINVGYTRRSGDGTLAAVDATIWTVSSGFPVAGGLGWVAEVFGYPGTSGPAGTAPIVAFLTGPTFTVQRSLVLDTGLILDITGFGGTALYAGVTWNMGWLPGTHRTRPAPRP